MSHPKALARGLLFAGLLAAMLAVPAVFGPGNAGAAGFARPLPALQRQAADHIVISEFRWSGPNGAADELIELYNPTASDISIENWTIWRTSACLGEIGALPPFAAGATVPAGGHFLIGGAGFLGQADVQTDIGIADAGGIALVSDTVFDPTKIVDQVGSETQSDCPGTTTYHEGTNLNPLPGNTDASYERKYGGQFGSCVDTDDNAADFTSRSPSDPQTTTSPLTPCGMPDSTPTNTATNTATDTATASPTATTACSLIPTPQFYSARSVLINEIAWSGTAYSAAHEWVELHNTNSLCPVDLDDWHLIGIRSGGTTAFDIAFNNSDDIPAGGYYVLATDGDSTAGADVFEDNVIISRDMVARPPESGSFGLLDTGLTLYLYGPGEETVDTANIGSGFPSAWPAGSTTNRRSMERYRNAPDTRSNWVTFNRKNLPSDWPRARGGAGIINGSPGMANWSFSVTVTPSPAPTKGRTATPRPATPFGRMLINEFLPRAGTDWNQDGGVNVYDEFIELKNLGPVEVNLQNWKLDDAADAGSPPYTLPEIKLKPGERRVFYGLTTRILLEDSGDTVRLINPRGIVIDARSYGVVEHRDQSHCRLPDGLYWRLGCFPTPGNENALAGTAPAPAPAKLGAPPPCLLPDTVPEPFRQAECAGFGSDIWDRTYWEDRSGPEQSIFQDPHHKGKIILE